MPSSAPARPRTPASTTTERQTWRRVIPAARRMPISRTRSMTFMVSVLTMPSAAIRTATAASASNSPKIRPSASLIAPSIRSSGTTSSASAVAAPASVSRAEAGASGREADGEDVGAGDPEARRRVAPADRASPRRSGRGATARRCPATRRSRLAAVGRRDQDDLADGQRRVARPGRPARSSRRRHRARRARRPGRRRRSAAGHRPPGRRRRPRPRRCACPRGRRRRSRSG